MLPDLRHLGRWDPVPPMWLEGRFYLEYIRLIRNPVFYDPFRFPDTAKARRAEVADRMHTLGDLPTVDVERIKAEPLPAKPADQPVAPELGSRWSGTAAEGCLRRCWRIASLS